MSMANIRIVLVRTSHPGNIGAAARAMKNMGLSRLYLVEPGDFPSDVANARASGAEDVLEQARICQNLDEAISGCHYVMTTTARQRSLAWDNLDAHSGAVETVKQAGQGEVAVVFGPERTGLGNPEIERSHCLIHIPVDEGFSSMNLAAAVMLVCYELRQASIGVPPQSKEVPDIDDVPATTDQIEGFVTHLQQVMDEIGFFTNKPSNRLMRRLWRLFNRSRMSEQDVNILRGVLAGVQSEIRRNKTGNE